MDPARYTSDPGLFRYRLDRLNPVLRSQVSPLATAENLRRSRWPETIKDALRRATRLHEALTLRNVHPDVLRFCNAERIQENYFHAVFEAIKSITAKIRGLSGSSDDGADLVHEAFGQ